MYFLCHSKKVLLETPISEDEIARMAFGRGFDELLDCVGAVHGFYLRLWQREAPMRAAVLELAAWRIKRFCYFFSENAKTRIRVGFGEKKSCGGPQHSKTASAR